MLGYISARCLRALATLLLIVTVTFVVLRLSGDAAVNIIGLDASKEALREFRRTWGLDQSLWVQYVRYLQAVMEGNLGRSMLDGRNALDVVVDRLPATLAITIPGFILQLMVGIPAGVFSALRRDTWLDRLMMTGSIVGFTMPSFVLGLLLVMLFAVRLHWLPSGGAGTIYHIILPVLTLGVFGGATLARFTRSAIIDVLGQPHVRAAKLRGIPRTRMVLLHVIPNAALPVVTIIGLMLGGLVAGAVVVESVFSWPGIGRLLVDSVANRDLAVVQTILLMIGAAMVLANFGVDLLYGLLDPRLRHRQVNSTSKG
ncbi:ABC transporter permease [Paraburkholderia aspalathi]|uniref:Peptide/nickel transport system permease protein n=1 Tax=Paraburkholderia aspalathi TaxID=1324617 RepID=A0A1I7B931_9BURK|nr:ABC transporter permease [Paraburkholderia aspalathi]SFT83664.1 peptide/nickel transport system permease protein [Paraburkholderia aspalathi]